MIIEYRDTLGGRVAHTDFGKDPNGDPYTVELGANWVSKRGQLAGGLTDRDRCKDSARLVVLVS